MEASLSMRSRMGKDTCPKSANIHRSKGHVNMPPTFPVVFVRVNMPPTFRHHHALEASAWASTPFFSHRQQRMDERHPLPPQSLRCGSAGIRAQRGLGVPLIPSSQISECPGGVASSFSACAARCQSEGGIPMLGPLRHPCARSLK